ncbi:hypothetical protein PG984_004977 [Apiospora sp. TS-2023a]
MGKPKKHTVPEHGKAHPHHHHHHHQQRPEALALNEAFNPAPAWSPVMLTESFAYTALQGPNGQPIGWRISGIDAYTSSNARSYPAAWASGHQSAPAYGTYLAPQNVPTAAQQPGAGISAGASTFCRTMAGILSTPTGGRTRAVTVTTPALRRIRRFARRRGRSSPQVIGIVTPHDSPADTGSTEAGRRTGRGRMVMAIMQRRRPSRSTRCTGGSATTHSRITDRKLDGAGGKGSTDG